MLQSDFFTNPKDFLLFMNAAVDEENWSIMIMMMIVATMMMVAMMMMITNTVISLKCNVITLNWNFRQTISFIVKVMMTHTHCVTQV